MKGKCPKCGYKPPQKRDGKGCPRCKKWHGVHSWYYCLSCMEKGAPRVLGHRVDYYRKKYGKNWWRILVKKQRSKII